MNQIQTVGIVSKPNLEQCGELVRGLLKWLAEREITARCDEQTALYAGITEFYSRETLPDGTQMILGTEQNPG